MRFSGWPSNASRRKNSSGISSSAAPPAIRTHRNRSGPDSAGASAALIAIAVAIPTSIAPVRSDEASSEPATTAATPPQPIQRQRFGDRRRRSMKIGTSGNARMP